MMEIPLLQQLPQPPSLTYTAPPRCVHTEHAAAAALCLSDSNVSLLDPHLMLLLHCSEGVVPHASHFISKHPVSFDNSNFKDVLLTSSGHSAEAGDGSVLRDPVEHSDESFLQTTIANHVQGGAAAQKPKSLLAQKQITVARKLQAAVATPRRKIFMTTGLSWGERVSLQQFHQDRMASVPFTARVVHAGRILACFLIEGNICTVDCLGWIKW